MPSWTINGAQNTAQQIVNAPTCEGKGKCVVLANNSPADTLFFSTDPTELNNAKSNGQSNIGIPLNPGEKIVIPWVTSAIWAINYNSGATPSDLISAAVWE